MSLNYKRCVFTLSR